MPSPQLQRAVHAFRKALPDAVESISQRVWRFAVLFRAETLDTLLPEYRLTSSSRERITTFTLPASLALPPTLLRSPLAPPPAARSTDQKSSAPARRCVGAP